MAVLTRSKEISGLVDLLPENEQTLAYEFIKRMVLAWDSDYTKLTPAERKRLEAAEQDFITGDIVRHEDIDWD
ncbi:MAG: hypothetical protein FWD03_09950 [Defluviitaleaceae bacterium]|nr:hypothetical protein [Defluviitaleaceae bacterium]